MYLFDQSKPVFVNVQEEVLFGPVSVFGILSYRNGLALLGKCLFQLSLFADQLFYW